MDTEVAEINVAPKVEISAPLKFTDQTRSDYLAFLDTQAEISSAYAAKVNKADPTFRESQEYKSYFKVREHVGTLGDGDRLIKYILLADDEDTRKTSFYHEARNQENEIVGYEFTRVIDGGKKVSGEFIGTKLGSTDFDIPRKLMEARHETLRGLGIHDYEARMLIRTANLIKRGGFKIEPIEDEGNNERISLYRISI